VPQFGKVHRDSRWPVDTALAPPISLTRKINIGRQSDPSSLGPRTDGDPVAGQRYRMWAKIAIFFAKLERLFWIGFGFVLVPIASLCLPDRHMQ
jgi:hypothetical protein